ncbi:helix-turn-helix domain-containing protein [Clostridium sp.]|uniref:helix-turn-helix domain-containing protein n=1 Tax=Clostridium sp. TaxID=1506 RepID=UPI002FC7EAFB
MNEGKRRFSLEENFMKGNVNDIIYGKLQAVSKINEKKERYSFSTDFNLKDLAAKLQVSDRTISRHLKSLEAAGFIIKGKELHQEGKMKSCFYLPYNVNERYKLIPTTTLEFLLDVAKPKVIKAYLYFLDKYSWKEKTKETYVFTNEEVMIGIGLKINDSKNYQQMRNILISLENHGLISYVEFRHKGVIPNKRLTNVSLVVKGLEKETQKEFAQEEKIIELNSVVYPKQQYEEFKSSVEVAKDNNIPIEYLGENLIKYISTGKIFNIIGASSFEIEEELKL